MSPQPHKHLPATLVRNAVTAILPVLALLLPLLSATSCEEAHLNEADFVTTVTKVSLIVGGKTLMEYDESSDQMAWREKDLQFRLMDDSLNDFFVVTLSTLPSEMGETLQAEVLYTTDTDIKTVSGTFNASKISSNSLGQMIWLWNSSADLAVIVQTLR